MHDIRMAIAIFTNIESEEYTDREKAWAIFQVMNMPTHMSITKSDILTALRWLWHETYEIEVMGDG